MADKYKSSRFQYLLNLSGAAGAVLIASAENANAATVTLPQTISAGQANWYVSDTTTAYTGSPLGLGITEASLLSPSTRGDAYDGAFVMQVNGTVFKSPGGQADLTGTTLTSGVESMGGLNVSVQYYFDTATPTVRALYSYTNPTGAPISATVQLTWNLGSDTSTAIVATSSGDAVYDATDRWVISWDGNPTGDPTLTLVRFGPGASLTPTITSAPGPAAQRDRIGDSYALTVPAGATRRIMVFGRLSQSNAAAEASVSAFDSVTALSSAGLLNGLTAQQENEIVNWPFAASVTAGPLMGTGTLCMMAMLLVATLKFLRSRASA